MAFLCHYAVMGISHWPREHRLAFWAIVTPAVLAVAGLVVTAVQNGGNAASAPIVVNSGTNIGTINSSVNNGTINNYGDQGQQQCPDLAGGQGVAAAGTGVSVDLYVRPARVGNCWLRALHPTGQLAVMVQFELVYRNLGPETQKNVVLGVHLPPGLTLVPDSVWLANSSSPDGKNLGSGEGLLEGGYAIGSYTKGANAYLVFTAYTSEASVLACGDTKLATFGVARPEGMNEFYNTAIVTVTRTEC